MGPTLSTIGFSIGALVESALRFRKWLLKYPQSKHYYLFEGIVNVEEIEEYYMYLTQHFPELSVNKIQERISLGISSQAEYERVRQVKFNF